MARRRTPSALAAAFVVAALLTACGGGGDTPAAEDTAAADAATTAPASPSPDATLALVAGSTVVGLPDGVVPPADLSAPAGAARTSDDALLHVVTFGSSTCPAVADPTATAADDGGVAVTFPEPADGPCTMDYVPATTVVALPDGTPADQDLTVTIGTWGQVVLPAGSTDPVWVTPAG